MFGVEWTVSVSIISTLFLLICFLLQRRRARFAVMSLIPGPRPLPLLGNLLHFIGCSPTQLFNKINALSCGAITALWMGPQPLILLSEAEALEPLLSSSKLIDKEQNYRLLHDWIGTGILCSAGDKWRQRRKLLTPTFHFSILESFLPVMNEQATILVNLLEKSMDKVDIERFVGNCTLDIICETAMGVKVQAQTTESSYVKALHEIDRLFIYRRFRPWLANDFIFSLTKSYKEYWRCLKVIHDKSLEVIKGRKESREKGEHRDCKRKAFLDLMLDVGGLSNEALKEEVNMFMFAGHDTTSVAVKWCLLLLGQSENSDIQARIHQELDEIFQESHRDAVTEDIRAMKYLERCIKESLRIYPSIAIFGRELTEDVTVKGYKLPAGVGVGCNIFMLHRDEKQFPDPERFDPDRFLPENCANRHPFAYIPFSAGPRNCIGQKFGMLEAKVVLSVILRRFNVKSLQSRDEVHITRSLTLKSQETVYLQLHNRD